MTLILVTGGARSGKSRIAEARALRLGATVTYIATAQPLDPEMEARIATHRDRRGAEWTTVDAPLDLVAAIDGSDGVRLVDCLTLWLSNLMLDGRDLPAETAGLLASLSRARTPVVLVTNEVGAGIVPDNALARAFRDAAGILNQQVAEVADEVILVACGLPLTLKGPA